MPWRQRIIPPLTVSLAALALSGLARGDELPKSERKGPLAALPSRPGTHIDKIKAMGDNEWLNLGAPAADPRWGKARGRSWGAKALVLAPDLCGAFLFGEGVHAFVKPDGHAMDDLWFYDINAHRWICLYPGMDTRTFTRKVKDKELRIGDNGLLIDKDGQVLPVHTLIHAWGFLAYDCDRKKFVFLAGNGLGRYFLGGEKQMDEGLKLLEEQSKQQSNKQRLFSPWYYDAASGRFERVGTAGSMGDAARSSSLGGGFPQLHYLQASKQFLVIGPSGVMFFDPAANRWREVKSKGPTPKGYDGCGCHDPKRNRIYRNDGDGGEGKGLMGYDIASNTWIELKPKGAAPAPANTNAAFYEYDPLHDKIVSLHFRGKTPGVFVYDPQSNTWEEPLTIPAAVLKHRFAANTCYDPKLNAFFCHVAGDSQDDGEIWVYRYKRR